MAELKTKPSEDNVIKFVNNITDEQQKLDSHKLIEIMQKVSNEKPVMWGSSIIGFGKVHLKYASGRELDWLKIGFSPRKGKITLYLTMEAEKLTSNYPELGRFKLGKGCIYINKMSDVNEKHLANMISQAYKESFASLVD